MLFTGPRPNADPTGPRLWFQRVPEPKTVKNRVHIDVRASNRSAEVERLVDLGATVLVESAELDLTVLQDPEGNEFCIIGQPPLLLTELRSVLRRDRFRRFLSLAEVDDLVDELGRLLRIEPDPEPGVPELRNPKDDYVLFLARAVGADYIVSGDADLTDATLEPPAITPRQAIDLFGLH